jgi:hypothetical protein
MMVAKMSKRQHFLHDENRRLLLKRFSAAAGVLQLNACAGSDSSVATASVPLAQMRQVRLALPPPTLTQLQIDANTVLDWAELNFTSLFAPANQGSNSQLGYFWRYYPGTNSFLGINDDGNPAHLFYSGGVDNASLVDLGLLSSWLIRARGKMAEANMPLWRQGQAINNWREIPNTSLSLAPPSVIVPGYSGPASKIATWCGLAIDNRNADVFSTAGGGHHDYSGNEVNSIRLLDDAPKWIERRPASPAGNVTIDMPYYQDGTPTSRHSYYAHHFIEQRERAMHFYVGSTYGNGVSSWAVDGFAPKTNTWDAAGSYPWANASGHPVGSALTVDPYTGNAYMVNASGYAVNQWNQSTNQWTVLIKDVPKLTGYYVASAFDVKRNRILYLGGEMGTRIGSQNAMVFDVASRTATVVGLTGPDAAMISAISAAGMVYFPELDAYIVQTGKDAGACWSINAATYAIASVNTGHSGDAIAMATNGVFTRFLWAPKLGGIVYYPEYSGNMWFLRLI